MATADLGCIAAINASVARLLPGLALVPPWPAPMALARPAAMTLVQALGALQLAPVAPAKTLLLRCRRCATTCSSLLSVAGASKLDPALPEINKRPLSFGAGSLAQGRAADVPSSSGQRVALSLVTCCSCTGCSPVPNRR